MNGKEVGQSALLFLPVWRSAHIKKPGVTRKSLDCKPEMFKFMNKQFFDYRLV